jgi:phosphate transport system substrate-binding protein
MKQNITMTLAVCGLLAAAAIAQAQVSGAGATFPELLYNSWAKEYKASGGEAINYQGIGSGGGIKAITAKTVDFGASDGPMSAAELQSAPGILHIPMCIGGVVPAFNLPGVANLKLTGPVIADIYLHKITQWNDAQIAKLNPGVALPARQIITVSRADGSGTTAIFTNYLCKISPAFLAGVGEGKAINWPKPGVAQKGNPGVAAFVKSTPGAFGYIEQAFADKNQISYASVQNAKGAFIKASLASVTEAATSARLPSDFRAMITNTNDPEGYPIAGFTWILIYPDTKPEVKKFLRWCLTNGQKSATKYDYAPLPAPIQQRALAALGKVGG